jgi:hypothetical protein
VGPQVRSEARKNLKKLWNPSSIENQIAWDKIKDANRRAIVRTVVDEAIIPTTNNQKPNFDKVTTTIESHTKNYIYPSGKTFEESIEEKIKDISFWDVVF